MKVRLRDADRLRWDDVGPELARGGRFVVYETCVSACLVSFRLPSQIYFLRGNEAGWLSGLPYTMLSLLLGWWAVPWGLIYTPWVVYTNLRGGRDVTERVLAQWPDEDGGPPLTGPPQ